MKTSRVLGAIAPVLLLLGAPATASTPSAAVGASVTVASFAFSPARVSVAQGQSVTWTFPESTAHTVTSDDGFFDTGPQSGGASRSVRFASAGAFGYHCSFHSIMVGKVTVPLLSTGSASTGYKLRWLTGKAPKGRTFDVQVRKAGTTKWTNFRTDVTNATGAFDPSSSGSYAVRARTGKGSGAKSGWSPAITLAVS